MTAHRRKKKIMRSKPDRFTRWAQNRTSTLASDTAVNKMDVMGLLRCSLTAASSFAISVCVLSQGGCSRVPRAEANRQPAAVEVAVALPLVQPIVEWDQFTGRLEPIEFVEVRAKVTGYLVELHFSEGQIVSEGDLLLEIDPRPFESELRRAMAGLAEANARVEEARANLVRVRAEKSQSETSLRLRAQQLDRARQLSANNAIAREDVEIRESEYLRAEADILAADAAIEAFQAAIATALAGVETAQSNVQTAKLNVSYTQVTAPVDGRIGRRDVTVGNLVTGGTSLGTLLTTIVSIDPIHVSFDADEQSHLKYTRLANNGSRESSREVKNPVFMALVDEQGYPHQGHMDFVDNRIDPRTGTIRGRAIFPNPDGLLTPGLFARVRIPGSGRYEAVMIPDVAILSDQSDRFVYVVNDLEKVERRLVRTGSMHNGLRVIRDGLGATDRVVVSGTQRVFPGTEVTPIEQVIRPTRDDGLPDDYHPVSEEEWLTLRRSRQSKPPTFRSDAESELGAASGTDESVKEPAAGEPQ